MVVHKDLVQRILDILGAYVGLQVKPTGPIAKYWFGVPKAPETIDYPYIYVQWEREVREAMTVKPKRAKHVRFRIVVVERHPDEDTGEKAAYDKADSIVTALEARPRLTHPDTVTDPLALESDVSELLPIVPTVASDYAITGMAVILTALVYE
jgi:hypothetical protein